MRARRVGRATALAALALLAGAGTCSIGSDDPAEELALGALGLELFIGIAAVAGALLLPVPGRVGARLGLHRGRLSAPQLSLLVLGALALSHGLDGVIELLAGEDRGVLAEFERLIGGARGRALLVTVVGIGIAPGIAEELMFRGLIQRGIERRLGPAAAIALASLVFGAIHVDPVQAPAAAVVGLYLGAVAYLAASIRASILCHACNNLMAVLLTAGGLAPPVSAASSAVLGLGIGAALLGGVWRWAGAPAPPENAAGAASAGGEAAHSRELQRDAGPDDG